MAVKEMPSGQVGRSLPRLEGAAKVTGQADYVHNLRLPGMLHVKVFRSSIPHGRIRRLDVSAAKQLPGVYSSSDVLVAERADAHITKVAGVRDREG